MEKNNSRVMENKKNDSNFSYFSALEKLFFDIQERPREIIKERYGIKSNKEKTLEEIGRDYKITRERVRQIIRETIKKIKRTKPEIISKALDQVRFTIKEKSGIIKEEFLIAEDLENKERGSLNFFLEIFDEIKSGEISKELEKSWFDGGFDLAKWRKIINSVKEILEKNKKPLTIEEILENDVVIEKNKLVNYLEVSFEIKKGNFGKWGLREWEEINPKGTREKIYLILKEIGKPLHFREIARLIDKHKLNKKKNTHPQTVHNELIRDKRFILVGRGIYALSEWGFKKGTVREVLEDILKKNNQPMEKNEIMNKILNIRKVKKSTVLINLNNFFERVDKDQYFIKK